METILTIGVAIGLTGGFIFFWLAVAAFGSYVYLTHTKTGRAKREGGTIDMEDGHS